MAHCGGRMGACVRACGVLGRLEVRGGGYHFILFGEGALPAVCTVVALGSANKTVIAPVRLIWALAAIAGGLPASCLPSIVITNDTETSRPTPLTPFTVHTPQNAPQ